MDEKRILVIEDDPSMAKLIQLNLEDQGYTVACALGGPEGLRLAEGFNPQVITLDLLMPGMDGFETLQHLKNNPKTQHIPVVIVSVLEGTDHSGALNLNIFEHFTKPIDFDRLNSKIAQLAKVGMVLSAAQPLTTGGTRRVLLVDDDNENVQLLQAFLSAQGYHVITAASGAEALKRAKLDKPELILMDVVLPDISGLEVLQHLKKDPDTANIAVVIVSALRFLEMGDRVVLTGRAEAADQPLSREQFLAEIQREVRRLVDHERQDTRDKPKILVADDEEHLLNLMKYQLEDAGYSVITARDGEEALDRILHEAPDLVLLDIRMPKLDGFQVCQRLKKDVLYRNLPVIMLTVLGETRHKVQGLETGADDYVAKPFVAEELLARVRTVLRRTSSGIEANPLTKLPGNVSIEREINDRIKRDQPFMVLYLDLNSFKAFNDVYGFDRGDRVIRETAHIILDVVKQMGAPDDFIGHIGGDDFIVVTSPACAERICQGVISRFNILSPTLYDPVDREQGYIVTMDRQGVQRQFPLLSLAIGGVSNIVRPLRSLGQVSAIGAEMKRFAKTKPGSCFVIDRRKAP